MASLGLRPPQFSEDVAWLPCWLQNLRTDGPHEFSKESQVPSNRFMKDLEPSQENGCDDKVINALPREEGGYKSFHLLLSGEDSSSVSVAPSPGNVVHFSLRLSSDVDSPVCPTQDLDASRDPVASTEVQSLQPVETSIDFRENIHSMTNYHSCEQNVFPSFIPETVEEDASKSLIDTIDFATQQKERSKVKCRKRDDFSDAVELSIAASEALVIHDLVRMGLASKKMRAEAVLEVALRVKQVRLEGLEDGFHSSSEESDCSDSLSDLNDFLMADAYEDIGLPFGVSIGAHLCNSAIPQAKAMSGAQNYIGCNNNHSDRDLPSQTANFYNNPVQQLSKVNVEVKMQQKRDQPFGSLCREKRMYSDTPGLGSNKPKHFENDLTIPHQLIQHSSKVLSQNQTIGSSMVNRTLNKPQNSVNSLLVETSGNLIYSEKENQKTYLVSERFTSRWLGGWTCKELDSSSLNDNNAEWISKHFIRETSFLSESVDIAPDEGSCVQKHHSKLAIGSQLSMPSEGLHDKADAGILLSQDLVKCSNQSLADPLCSVVPCSISSERANSKTQSDKENGSENSVPPISEFVVDNVQRISDENVALDCKDEQILPLQDGKDIPITLSKVSEQMPEKLTRVEHCHWKQFTSLKTYSMILPDLSFNQNCNFTLLQSNQSLGGVASSETRICTAYSADGNKNEEKNEHFVDLKSIREITGEKRSDDLKEKAAKASDILAETTQERKSPLILNCRTRRLLGPKTVLKDINVEKHLKQHVEQETFVQHQQNKNLNNLQVECNKFNDGHIAVRKQLRFSETEEQLHRKRKFSKLESSYKRCSSVRSKRQRVLQPLTNSVPHMKHSLTNDCRRVMNKFIFQGTEFLLTGLSNKKERDVEALIRSSGGLVLSDIPSPPNSRAKRNSRFFLLQLPIILCMRKLQTAKFLYGCAVGASILKVDWLTDSIASGALLRPEKYMILPNRGVMKWTRIEMAVRSRNQIHIFERMGIMLHGKHSFCAKLASIIKHGGGQVFKTLQWLVRSIDEDRTSVGAIVVEDKTTVSRHLKHCALERDIPIMPSSWIIKSLYLGKLLPLKEENVTSPFPIVTVPEVPSSVDMSEEI